MDINEKRSISQMISKKNKISACINCKINHFCCDNNKECNKCLSINIKCDRSLESNLKKRKKNNKKINKKTNLSNKKSKLNDNDDFVPLTNIERNNEDQFVKPPLKIKIISKNQNQNQNQETFNNTNNCVNSEKFVPVLPAHLSDYKITYLTNLYLKKCDFDEITMTINNMYYK